MHHSRTIKKITSVHPVSSVVLSVWLVALCGCPAKTGQVPQLSQPADGRTFLSFRAAADHVPDADINSVFWKGIPPITLDKSVMGPEQPAFRAEIRARWTDKHLYFLYACHYEKLTLYPNPKLDTETPRLWERDVFELYIGADFERTNLYRELQISPQGEFLDNNINSTVNRPGFNGEDAWNSGYKVRARIDEQNKIWYGEMQIPLAAIDQRPAKPGNEMRINFYRQDTPAAPAAVPRELLRGNRVFLAWQPPGVWNPHHPEKFGTLRLVDHP